MVTTVNVVKDEPQRERLMLAVGEGITQFAMVEISLAHLYAHMMAPGPGALVYASWEAATHFETKIRILRAAAARRKWPEGFAERFANLVNKAKNRADTRNKIAHWMVTHLSEQTKKGRKSGFVLMSPNLTNPARAKDSLSPAEVEEFAHLCGQLAMELIQFRFDLASAEGRSEETDNVGG